jgi:hypothetical protein
LGFVFLESAIWYYLIRYVKTENQPED